VEGRNQIQSGAGIVQAGEFTGRKLNINHVTLVEIPSKLQVGMLIIFMHEEVDELYLFFPFDDSNRIQMLHAVLVGWERPIWQVSTRCYNIHFII
jgi:hypothetical protein